MYWFLFAMDLSICAPKKSKRRDEKLKKPKYET
jgi:hypothetical protein